MTRSVLRSVLVCLCICISAALPAVPARPGTARIVQPDGSSVQVTVRGDEYGHVMVTTDGCAVTRGADGFLSYLRFDADGSRHDTGVRVSSVAAPSVIAESRAIPYNALRRQSSLSRYRAHASYPATRAGSSHSAIVLLAQFKDLLFENGRDRFSDLLTKTGYSYNSATGSVLDYFNDQFGGAAEFLFEVGPVVTLSRGYAYYGEDDSKGDDMHAAEAVSEACILSDPEVDFSKYDYVYVFYAGGNPADGGASDDHIWPHSWNLEDAGISLILDGKHIGAYGASSELVNTGKSSLDFATIGTFCHEYCHVLGLCDMYDTDYEESSGQSAGLWHSTSIMDSGNYNNNGRTPPCFNAIELSQLGLVTPEKAVIGYYTLEPVSSSRRVLMVDTDKDDEYFLVESRQALGWDKYIGGSGMLVYHVDRSDNPAGYSTAYGRTLTAAERWEFDEVNCNPSHQCADLVEAASAAYSVSDVFFPTASVTSLSAKTNESFLYWSGDSPLLSFNSIKRVNGTVSFEINGPVVVDVQDVYQDAAIFNWHTDIAACAELPTYISWEDGSGSHEMEVQPYSEGCYAYTIEGLSPQTGYSVTISYKGEEYSDNSVTLQISTRERSGLPFIYLSSAGRNSVGKFNPGTRIPLRVYNLASARDVTWYLDGCEVTVGDDGYYELTSDGTLKAVVTYTDGSEEVFIKTIKVR